MPDIHAQNPSFANHEIHPAQQAVDLNAALRQVYDDYLQHQRGLVSLWMWLEQWIAIKGWSWEAPKGDALEDNDSTPAAFRLSPMLSGRFILGRPKPVRGIRGRELFLGLFAQEEVWAARLLWRQACWDDINGLLWLISQGVKSPDSRWPDLPSVAIGIVIDPPEKLEMWTKVAPHQWRRPHLQSRRLSWGENKQICVARSPSAWGWAVARGSLWDNWSAMDRRLDRTLHDVTMDKLRATNRFVDPGFQGKAAPAVKGLEGLNQPYRKADFQGVDREVARQNALIAAHPEIFGQFLDPQSSR